LAQGGLHLLTDRVHESFAGGEVLGVDRGEESDCGYSGEDFQASLAHHLRGALDDDGDHGGVGLGGEEEGAFLEGQEVAVGGTGAFGKDEDVHAAAESVGRDGYGLFSFGAGVATRDGDVFGHPHGDADKGNFHQRLLEEDTAHAGDGGQEDGRVEVGDVVAEENAGLLGRDIFCALNNDANATGANAGTHGEHGPAIHCSDIACQERVRNADEGGGQAEEDEDEEHA